VVAHPPSYFLSSGKQVYLYGNDAGIFKSLLRKGLLKHHPATGEHSYSITEDGILALSQITEAR
jgi:hypothetical protein